VPPGDFQQPLVCQRFDHFGRAHRFLRLADCGCERTGASVVSAHCRMTLAGPAYRERQRARTCPSRPLEAGRHNVDHRCPARPHFSPLVAEFARIQGVVCVCRKSGEFRLGRVVGSATGW
jgi:hypothetical protein